MDFFTFIIIAVFIYNLFAKKDKQPQRRPGRTGDMTPNQPHPVTNQPRTQTQERKKKESLLESLERQIRESAEQLEKELQGGKTVINKPVPVETSSRRREYRMAPSNRRERNYQGTEGSWGEEGRSDYDRYVSTQGTQGTEGTQAHEGTWGAEGSYYAQRRNTNTDTIEKSTIEKGEIGAKGARLITNKERLAALGFSPSQAVQGIIWAEILKEPRGRRALSRR